ARPMPCATPRLAPPPCSPSAAAPPSRANVWSRPSPRLACKRFPTRRLFFAFLRRSSGTVFAERGGRGSKMGHAAQLAQEAEFFDRWAEQRAKDLEPLDPSGAGAVSKAREAVPEGVFLPAAGRSPRQDHPRRRVRRR